MTDDPPPPRHPDDYAIVVGIQQYAGFSELPGAERDAVRFVEWLISNDGGGLPRANVRLIVSSRFPKLEHHAFARPVQDDVDAELIDLIQGTLDGTTERIGRRLYFYFAGHGVGPTVDNVAMLMANARTFVLNSNLGLQRYKNYLIDAAPFDEVVMLLDCCRELASNVDPRGPILSHRQNRPRARDVRHFVALACEYGQRAFEDPPPGSDEHGGYFTRGLLEGLRSGAADATGSITAASLARYLKEQVPRIADQQRAQRPTVFDQYPDMVFGRPVARPRTSVTIAPPDSAPPASVLRLEGNGIDPRCHAVAEGAWNVTLGPGLYKAAIWDADGQELADRLFEVRLGQETLDVQL